MHCKGLELSIICNMKTILHSTMQNKLYLNKNSMILAAKLLFTDYYL